MKKNAFKIKVGLIPCLLSSAVASTVAQEVLPFPQTPSASIAGRTMEESVHKRRVSKKHLSNDAPNVVIILIDDAGPGQPNTFGGPFNTPTLSKIANNGVAFNCFNSTAQSSPSRAALLTGRNHTRVGSGVITEMAADWDGFTGIIPKTAATLPEVLKNYGYSTAAFGKWHNSPPADASRIGPFDYWPTGYGFEYFYGFLSGEASQYEPTLIRNTTYVNPPRTPEQGYHVTEDLADDAISWIHNQKSLAPDKPFFVYWATGGIHGPHHVAKEWADKYKGKFDAGWDEYRKTTFNKQKELGWIPQNTVLTERHATMPAWKDIPESERAFQLRLMEVYAGFAEHTDYQAGRVVQAIEDMGEMDNTIIIYIWGDNGASAEGQNGTLSELLAMNQIPTKVEDHIKALDKIGGLDALGGPKADNMMHSAWGWAGSTPFKGTKNQGSHFGGTRQPMAISWPKKIKADKTPRPQFHHFVDVLPTIYEAVGITEYPRVVNGFEQDPIDGVSMMYALNDPKAEGTRKTQFFDIFGSRGIYSDGWYACTIGPRLPWLTVTPGMATWTPDRDVWELYNLKEDYSQANDLAQSNPQKLADMKELFLIESTKNKNLPIGASLLTVLHPEEVMENPATEFNYTQSSNRIPELMAPKIGLRAHTATIKLDCDSEANGVLYALGGYGGGLTVYAKKGILYYEYKLFGLEETKLVSKAKLPKGKSTVQVTLNPKPHASGPAYTRAGDVEIKVNGQSYLKGTIPTLIVSIFSFNECFDVGLDLGSPVAQDYYHDAPFAFNGKIESVNVKYKQ